MSHGGGGGGERPNGDDTKESLPVDDGCWTRCTEVICLLYSSSFFALSGGKGARAFVTFAAATHACFSHRCVCHTHSAQEKVWDSTLRVEHLDFMHFGHETSHSPGESRPSFAREATGTMIGHRSAM